MEKATKSESVNTDEVFSSVYTSIVFNKSGHINSKKDMIEIINHIKSSKEFYENSEVKAAISKAIIRYNIISNDI